MIEYDNGIHIKGTDLWLDARSKTDFCFVSHAHADHAIKHAEILATTETARLFQHRYGKATFRTLEYYRPRKIRGVKVQLFPSGHILGGAQIAIETGGVRIVYTGDFKLRKSMTARRAEVRKCDILIMESTFGRPHYVFPTPAEIHTRMVEFVEQARASRRVPVFVAYSLGKAQEAMKILSNRGYRLSVHQSVYNIAKIYEEFGIRFRDYKLFEDGDHLHRVLILPPQAQRSRMLAGIPRKRVAMLTGWAVDRDVSYYSGADEAIPLSDHADFSELIQYVSKAQPQKVYTVHGFSEFVRSLQERGFDAEPLKQGSSVKAHLSKELLTNYDLFA